VPRVSELLGRPVRDVADGTAVGRLEDLTIGLADDHPVVRAVVVGRPRRDRLVVPWHGVRAIDTDHVAVAFDDAVTVPRGSDVALASDELLVARDVLDAQVVDLTGRRLARVGDVLVADRADGAEVVVGVDVGFGAVCRRLGAERLGRRLGESVLDWRQVHLTGGRGHLVQLDAPAAAVHHLDDQELAALIERLSTGAAIDVLTSVPAPRAAGAIGATGDDVTGRLARALPDEHAAPIEAHLPAPVAHRFRRARARPHPRRRFLRHRRKRGRS